MVVLLALLYTWLSLRENVRLPEPFSFPHRDKVLHFMISGILAAGVIWAQKARQPGRRMCLMAWGCVTLHGGVIEWLQTYTNTRHGDWMDLCADGAGALVGLMVIRGLLSTRGPMTPGGHQPTEKP